MLNGSIAIPTTRPPINPTTRQKENRPMKHYPLLALVATLAACASTPESSGPSATAVVRPSSGTQVHGSLTFTQAGERVRITGEIVGHDPGPRGFHIHEKGDCSDPKAMSAGGHFNPAQAKHGAPGAGHAGDLGNLVFNEYGKATVDLTVSGLSVGKAANGVIGRAVIVHMAADDLKTDPTGNAGERVACGVIE
jgi:superoxide dismutase, Cu-Zn family